MNYVVFFDVDFYLTAEKRRVYAESRREEKADRAIRLCSY